MKKDIYVIKNSINDKVYVGQSINPHDRWLKHMHETKYKKDNMLIHKAMRKYGIENFYMEVIEHNVGNYDDREKCWIAKYNSIMPNGYNIAAGGSGIGSGTDSLACKITNETVDKIISLLKQSDLSNREIAEQCSCGQWTVWAINTGKAFFNPEYTYPIKKSTRYSDELLDNVINDLKYGLDMSIDDIATKHNIDASQVSEINQGAIHHRDTESYPLRIGKNKNVITQKKAESIISDLQMSDLSQTDIAKKHEVSITCVSGINRGRNFRRMNINYPIRNSHKIDLSKTCLDTKDVIKIENLLLHSDVTMRQIAKQFNVGTCTIQNINNGVYGKNANIKYPIRHALIQRGSADE